MGHITMHTAGPYLSNAIVIAFHADASLPGFADQLPGPVGIIAVPDAAGAAGGWRRQWNATVHGEPARAEEPPIDDPAGMKALEELFGWVNRGNALPNPRDKDYANRRLGILGAKDHGLPPVQVKSWALGNGWPSGAARDLARMADKAEALGRKPSLTRIHDPEGKYARWSAP